MPDITESVNKAIANDKNLQAQLEKSRREMSIFLDLLNIRLQRSGAYCNAYTLTVTTGIEQDPTKMSYLKH